MKKLNDLKQSRQAKFVELENITKVDEMTDEQRAKFDELENEISVMDKDIERLNKIDELNKKSARNEYDGEKKELNTLERKFDISKAFKERINGNLTGVEKEMNDEHRNQFSAQGLGSRSGAIYIPFNVMKRATQSKDGNFSHTEQDPFLSVVGPASLINVLGVDIKSGLNGNYDLPYMGSVSASFVGETSAASEFSYTPSKSTLTPRRLQGWKKFTSEYLAQTNPAVQNSIIAELVESINRGIMTDLLKQITGTTSATFSGGTSLTWKNITDLEGAINVESLMGKKAYLTTNSIKSALKSTIKSGSTSGFIWEGKEVNGYEAYSTDIALASKLIFGDFSYGNVGIWGNAVEVLINPYTEDSEGLVKVNVGILTDTAVRNPNAFAYGSIV